MSEDEDLVKIIKASKALQEKVGTGTVSAGLVQKAEMMMASNKVDFAPVAKPHMDELRKAIAKGKKDSGDFKATLDSLSAPIMNIKANAATFNYPLISGLTDSVLTFLEGIGHVDKKVFQIVDLLHMTIMLILSRKMSGDGGAEGRALLDAFRQVCNRHAQKLARKTA